MLWITNLERKDTFHCLDQVFLHTYIIYIHLIVNQRLLGAYICLKMKLRLLSYLELLEILTTGKLYADSGYSSCGLPVLLQ